MAGEGVEDFILRLREAFARWKRSDSGNVGEEGAALRPQFARGLVEGPIKEELQRQLRRAEPALSFEAVCKEALALERECSSRAALSCQARAASPQWPTI